MPKQPGNEDQTGAANSPHLGESRIAGAVVLAGGRSSRLGGTAKAALTIGGVSLLARTVAAVGDSLRSRQRAVSNVPLIVVGPAEQLRSLLGPCAAAGTALLTPTENRSEQPLILVREEPAFSGPAAALAAGLGRLITLAGSGNYVLVLACDMPRVSAVLPALLDRSIAADGVLATDQGRDQPLAAVYRIAALSDAIDRARRAGALANASLFSLIASLEVARTEVPAGSTADVDSWADAARLGVDGIPGISPPDAADGG
ncbi:molybdenum cofactor guanylyltransferase [Arthrobacter sp. H14-L1]|uniref:molybdenum cofactor guanylyltransferase n=1 Tax=Arthrobacter sp. H14-L1 TaxID=2996697 RepID=UPI00226F0AC6|nr:NTP transferase domain-containing protein [Arthrobacter sp. H14-L1]MCY0904806.1 NTP transferase domain-containing protein [Arthrobacter sp. H14-L1]